MANEKRLIDANRLAPIIEGEIIDGRAKAINETLRTVLDLIRAFPTVDAVEVVRCGNCVKRPKNVEWGMCHVLCRQTHKDDFCSYAEKRRDGDGNG